jgi:molybdopterin-guanine dinucleotide biosynthesis protein A
MAGIHAALSYGGTDAMFFATCDMPLLKRKSAEKLCNALEEGIDAVIAVTVDGRKHPLCGVYRKSTVGVFEDQLQAGNHRMMDALDRLQVLYVPLSEEDGLQLQNINTREDYLGIQK